MTCGMGLCFGPIVGSICYTLTGYAGTFYIFCIVLATCALTSHLLIPAHANFTKKENNVTVDSENEISYIRFFLNKTIRS